jgi:hypothetical protein
MAVDLTVMSVSTSPTLKSSPNTTFQRIIQNAVTSEAELGATTESETAGWAGVWSWNGNTLIVLVFLPITLVGAGVVCLIAVRYKLNRGQDHRTQHHKQVKYSQALASLAVVPLLKSQLAPVIKKQHGNRGSDGVGGTECHLHEQTV